MILCNHFLKETVKLTCFIICGLLILFITMRFASYLSEAASGKIAPEYVTQIVTLKMLVSLRELIPISLFLGAFTSMTKLQQHSEWVGMRAAGVSISSVIRNLLIVSGTAAIFVAVLSFGLLPKAELILIKLKEEGQNNASIAGIKAGNFKRFSAGTKIFYAETASKNTDFLENTFVHDDSQSNDAAMSASRAYIVDEENGKKLAVFENGTSYFGKAGTLNYVVTDFSSYKTTIKEKGSSNYTSYASFVPTSELFNGNPRYTVEIHWRLAPVLITFLSPLLALLLAMRVDGSRWYLSMTIALTGFFIYQNSLGILRALLKKGDVPLLIGLWPMHLLFIMLLLGLYVHLQNGFIFRSNNRLSRK